jgi:hypothetical protein
VGRGSEREREEEVEGRGGSREGQFKVGEQREESGTNGEEL